VATRKRSGRLWIPISSDQVGGSLGAPLLNAVAATAAANYLTRHQLHVSPQSATVHGDVTAFAFLAILFATGAVVTALLFPWRP
jgi:CBS domain containing-hemolysin-like protein